MSKLDRYGCDKNCINNAIICKGCSHRSYDKLCKSNYRKENYEEYRIYRKNYDLKNKNKNKIINEKFTFGEGRCTDTSASIDRINNNFGYIKGNVRIISMKANSVKNNATLEELELMLENWKKISFFT